MRMEYLEILLTDVKKQYIDSIVKQELKITTDLVTSSHFYDEFENKDMEYYDDINLERYFSNPNTGNIFVKELVLGESIKNVMIVISCDADFGDITLNFSESDFMTDNIDMLRTKIISIVNRLIEIQRKYKISSIRLGYESTIDDENVILDISNGNIVIPNEFQGQLAFAVKQLY